MTGPGFSRLEGRTSCYQIWMSKSIGTGVYPEVVTGQDWMFDLTGIVQAF